MISRDQVVESRGATVLGLDGSKVGTVEDVYVDRDTEQPEWVAVATGMFGTRTSLVPLAEATMEGSDVVVPYAKDHVKGAPTVDPSAELSQQEEAELYSYYGLPYSERSSDSGLPEGGAPEPSAGHDVSGPTTDDAMTRSEEELRVGKTPRTGTSPADDPVDGAPRRPAGAPSTTRRSVTIRRSVHHPPLRPPPAAPASPRRRPATVRNPAY